jgi:hypothetical protein
MNAAGVTPAALALTTFEHSHAIGFTRAQAS